MRRLFPTLALTLTLLLAGSVVAPAADATTGTPCGRHDANTPKVLLINNGQVILTASGGIGACPKPGSVAGTVNLQHFDGTGWVTDASADYAGSWGALYKYARQASNSVTATCTPGVPLRTYVDGGDGFKPTWWVSGTVTFPNHDGRCGELGGGD